LNHRSCCIYLYQPPQTTTVVRHHHAHDLQQKPLTKSSHRSQLDLARNPGPVRRSPFSLSARSATHNVGRSQRDRAGIPRGAPPPSSSRSRSRRRRLLYRGSSPMVTCAAPVCVAAMLDTAAVLGGELAHTCSRGLLGHLPAPTGSLADAPSTEERCRCMAGRNRGEPSAPVSCVRGREAALARRSIGSVEHGRDRRPRRGYGRGARLQTRPVPAARVPQQPCRSSHASSSLFSR